MAGISHNAKNSNLPEFGDSVSAGSKALCGLTEAAAQVKADTARSSNGTLVLLLVIPINLSNSFYQMTTEFGYLSPILIFSSANF